MTTSLITAAQREAAFRADLTALLGRHGADLQVTDDGKGYGMQSGVCRITMTSIYECDELAKDYCEFDL